MKQPICTFLDSKDVVLELDSVEVCDNYGYDSLDKKANTYESQYTSIIVDSNENSKKSSFESDNGLEIEHEPENMQEDQHLYVPIGLNDSSFR